MAKISFSPKDVIISVLTMLLIWFQGKEFLLFLLVKMDLRRHGRETIFFFIKGKIFLK